MSLENLKLLREETGISLMKCKEALEATDNDVEAARDWLRKSGENAAAKKEGRSTGEGRVGLAVENGRAALVAVRCETDFVARGDEYAALSNGVAEDVLAGNEAAAEEKVKAGIVKLGENIQMGECEHVEGQVLGSYIHSNGRIGVVVSMQTGTEELARDVAMHVAAMAPAVVSPEDVSEEDMQKERSVQEEIVAGENKPKEVQEKILEGRMKKFTEGQALLTQSFAKDPSKTVGQLLTEQGAESVRFIRVAI